MNYRLIFAPSFEADVHHQIEYWRDEHVGDHIIDAWFAKLYKRLDSLETWPRLYPADEQYTAQVGQETRKINFGDYLVMYQLDDQRGEIHVVAFFSGKTDWKR